MTSGHFVAMKLASSAAHLPSLASTQYLIGVVLGELVGDFVLLILPVLPDSMAVEGANDADSRIPTMKKNFILMGVRMMMLMVREYPQLPTTIMARNQRSSSFFQFCPESPLNMEAKFFLERILSTLVGTEKLMEILRNSSKLTLKFALVVHTIILRDLAETIFLQENLIVELRRIECT